MKIESCNPNIKLHDLVKEFVLLSNGNNKTKPIIAIDDACNDFMFLQEGTAKIKYGNNKLTETSLPVFAHRLESPMEFMPKIGVSYFTIKVQPWANSLFFPIKAPYGITNLKPLYGDAIIELHRNIFKAKSFLEKVKVAEEFLTRMNKHIDPDMILVKKICNIIYETEGMITVNELSDKINICRQTLNKIFFTYVNYTTKYFIILVRILSAAKFKLNHPSFSLTRVAHEFGYFDQSHFIYDFKRISGTTPTKLFKNLPVFLQRYKK